jgi:hypothetical protein
VPSVATAAPPLPAFPPLPTLPVAPAAPPLPILAPPEPDALGLPFSLSELELQPAMVAWEISANVRIEQGRGRDNIQGFPSDHSFTFKPVVTQAALLRLDDLPGLP